MQKQTVTRFPSYNGVEKCAAAVLSRSSDFFADRRKLSPEFRGGRPIQVGHANAGADGVYHDFCIGNGEERGQMPRGKGFDELGQWVSLQSVSL